MKKVLVLTDNILIFERFKDICLIKNKGDIEFSYRCSPSSKDMFEECLEVNSLDVKTEYKAIIEIFDLVISCHCKKKFPAELVNNVRCINIHPGLNPYNRGWYPQVFAINNGLPHGVTIHEMDEEIDHGAIIVQKKITIDIRDTSASVYERVLSAEIELFNKHFDDLIDNTYSATVMNNEGNYNSIQDFKDMCQIDLNKKGTFLDFYNLVRSLTHGQYKNAYFIEDDGNKVFFNIAIEKNQK